MVASAFGECESPRKWHLVGDDGGQVDDDAGIAGRELVVRRVDLHVRVVDLAGAAAYVTVVIANWPSPPLGPAGVVEHDDVRVARRPVVLVLVALGGLGLGQVDARRAPPGQGALIEVAKAAVTICSACENVTCVEASF